ncbi:alpha/beta fold hydrolase [Reyranella sp. CPCC 100927]|uniref:alpha/beta fold hydrolase n=1 Tax=Reyranella sp. CPCC 100927 TaxID=2599616 RepID=UPI0011B45ED0|nr:alpha/beta hydrolase [Reyranella sp. CPCC 100927]TWS97063.1 alpha/beta hydrolase [Reyranella sp. CPCC 100927]
MTTFNDHASHRAIADLGAAPLLAGFRLLDVAVGADITIRAAVGGKGPPLLLLHGHPQTHVTWRKIAPALAERFTVVAADLRGYGDSSKPPGGENHRAYAKRSMARDQVALMQALGHPRFAVAGHDRGGRVAHRMALDHPDTVTRIAVMDVVPTATMYARTDKELATRYFWWFFLIQPAPLPERLIAADPEFFLRRHIDGQLKTPGATEPEAFAEYLRCYSDPATRHAICEDYRAAATIDLVHDAEDADARIRVPLLAIWGAKGSIDVLFDVPEAWREKALHVEGRAFDCGHTLQEERPQETITALLDFFSS